MAKEPTYPRFTPGAGLMPPLLAGRNREQAVLRPFIADLRSSVATPRDLVLIGPRGNGKTVLMRWFEAACGRQDGVDGRVIGASLASTAQTEVAPQRDAYYQDRYMELEERDLLPAAVPEIETGRIGARILNRRDGAPR